jgi:hypothetical protein
MGTGNNRKFSLFQWYDGTVDASAVGTSLHWSWMNDTNTTFVSDTIKNCLPKDKWTHACITY